METECCCVCFPHLIAFSDEESSKGRSSDMEKVIKVGCDDTEQEEQN